MNRVFLGLILLIGAGLRARSVLADAAPNMREQHQYYRAAACLEERGIFGFKPDCAPTAYRGILYPGLIAALGTTSRPAASRLYWAQALLGTLSVAVLYACGSLLFSTRAGLAAALLLALDPTHADFAGSAEIETFYTFLLLCLGGILLWWANKPSGPRSFFLGAAIGVTVLCRSVLGFFPFYLLAFGAIKKSSFPSPKRAALPLLAGFALVLSPWLARNAARFQRAVIFDQGGGSGILYMAALGYAHVVDQQAFDEITAARGAIPAAPELESPAVAGKDRLALRWRGEAIAAISSHPAPYLKSCLLRLLIYGPFLLVLPWMAARRRGDDPGICALSVLLSYFSAHLLAAISWRYLMVAAPQAYLLAAAFLLPREGRPPSGRLDRLAACCAFFLLAFYCVGLYWIGSDLSRL